MHQNVVVKNLFKSQKIIKFTILRKSFGVIFFVRSVILKIARYADQCQVTPFRSYRDKTQSGEAKPRAILLDIRGK